MEVLLNLVLLLLIGSSLLVYMMKEAFTNRVIYHDLEYPSFPKSFGKVKVFFISDIHRRKVSPKIVKQIQGHVDIVIIGGDLTEKGVPLQRVKDNIVELKKLGPVFFVWGNNDYEVEVQLLDALLLNMGVKVLANSSVQFQSEAGDHIYLLGIDDIGHKRDNLDHTLSETDEKSFKILVSHNPKIRRRFPREYGIHLILSGHTHGGQIRLFGWGLYGKGTLTKEQDTYVLVSNGYGTTGVPLRLGARAETHLITIQTSIDD